MRENTATMADPQPPPTPNQSEWKQVTPRTKPPPATIETAASTAPLEVMKPSIYQVFFPVSTSKDGSNPRDPYRCIKHILAILAKHCDGHLKILPHDDNDSNSDDICLWSDFPADPEHAKAYIFNVQTPRQSFGKKAGQNFRADFRVSCSSSVRWMKNKPAVANELARHQYWVTGRADGPTVQMRPILWLVKPDPDNCSAAQLKHLITKQLPEGTQILLEKHRLVCKPDPKNKQIFVTHALKLLAPTASAWTTKKLIDEYMYGTPDKSRPIPLRGVRSAGLSSNDISKMELSALITVQNEHLNKSTAVQIANVWNLDGTFQLTDRLIHLLETDKLETHYKVTPLKPFIENPDEPVTLRELMYAVLDSREDIPESPIVNDYLRGGMWNIVCSKEEIQAVTMFLEWFLHTLATDMGIERLAEMCGSFKPYDPNKQPRVTSVKQYNEAASCRLETDFGCRMDSFMKKYNLSNDDQPETTAPPDLTRPPRETFRPVHHARMKILPLERPTWASKLYEDSFAKKEPTINPYAAKRFQSYADAAVPQNAPAQTQPPTHPQAIPPSSPNAPSLDQQKTVPQTASTAQTTNVSSITPMTPAPVTPTKSEAPNPVSPVLADTQSKLAKLAEDVKTMHDHRDHIHARLDAFEKSQNTLTDTVESIAESVKDILSNQRKQASLDKKFMADEVNKLRKEVEQHLETIEKSSWEWQQKIEESNRAARGSDSEAMSIQSSDEGHSDAETSHDHSISLGSTNTITNSISIEDIPYKSSMAQFRVTPATELTTATAGGHPGQKRPIKDVTTSGTG